MFNLYKSWHLKVTTCCFTQSLCVWVSWLEPASVLELILVSWQLPKGLMGMSSVQRYEVINQSVGRKRVFQCKCMVCGSWRGDVLERGALVATVHQCFRLCRVPADQTEPRTSAAGCRAPKPAATSWSLVSVASVGTQTHRQDRLIKPPSPLWLLHL